MNAIDLVVLVVYLGGIVGFGLWVGRRGGSDAFMAANRGIPGWAVGLSIVGTYVSSITFLALPSKAFAGDWNAFVFTLTLPPAMWVAARYFVPFYRKAGSLSAYEHLERRFGPWARTYAVACYLLTQIARVGTILYLLALALAPLTGWSVPVLIGAGGLLTLVYTLYGGMEAVIWTDVVQSVVFIGGAAACILVLVFGVPDGAAELMRVSSAAHKFSFGSTSLDPGQSTVWVVLLYGLFINLQNFGIDQSYVQRYQTARSDRDARRSVWIGGWVYVPISAAFLFIGTGLFAFYTLRPERLPAALAQSPDSVFPHFIATELPSGISGLVVASLFAAAQSTVSSSINGAATLSLCDLYMRYIRPSAAERERLAVLRVSSLVFGVAGIAASLAMMRMRSALDAWWQLASIFSGGMLGLFLLGRLSRRARDVPARIGVGAGVLTILWMTLSTRSPFHPNLIIVIGTLMILLVGVAASAFFPSTTTSPGTGSPYS
jgi:SSS family solute:Na+ symporter